MGNYLKLRKAVFVFKQYGITLFGNNKKANLYRDLNMDPVFINGLVFELEFALQVEMDKNLELKMTVPAQLIQNLVEK